MDEAKAVLDRWTALGTWMGEEKELAAALAAVIEEVERLTAIPEDVERKAQNMDDMYHQWRRSGQPILADECKEAAAALRAYAARIAALTAIPADVEKMAKRLETDNRLVNGIFGKDVARTLRAYAAREADRGRVDAGVRAKIEAVIRGSNGHPWEATWNEIRAILGPAKSVLAARGK